jgi:zinc protease
MKYVIAILLSVPFLSLGQTDRSSKPTAGPAPIINIGESQTFTLPNGLTILLSENHKIPRVSIDFYSGSGQMLEGEKAGLRDFTGALILSGTETRSKDILDREKDFFGASFYASGSSASMSCLTKHLQKVVPLYADVLMHANFPEEEVERIRNQFQTNLKNTKSSPDQMAGNAISKINFPGHPFGEVMTEQTLNNITREDMLSFYRKMFSPSGSYLVVVGDIDMEQTRKIAEEFFGKWNGPESSRDSFAIPSRPAGNQVYFVPKAGAVQSVVKVSFPVNIRTGDERQLTLNVLNGVFGGNGFSTRLMQNLREDKGYTYGCYADMSVNEEGSWMSAGGNFRNEVTDSAIREILYEFKRIMDTPVGTDELALTKASMSGSFARSLEQPSTIARFAYNIKRYGMKPDMYQTYLKRLQATTENDINLAAKEFFSSDQCNIIVVGNEEIANKLIEFDADGTIQYLDAFGNPVEMSKSADITKEKLIEKYVLAVTQSTQMKEVEKKMKKIKSVVKNADVTFAGAPFSMTSKEIWMSPNAEGSKIEGNGMVIQKSYFDGKKGASSGMQGNTQLSDAEIAAKTKSVGLFPEINYHRTGMDFELKGIEKIDGKDVYVLIVSDGLSKTYDYFDKGSMMKIRSVNLREVNGQQMETTVDYADFKSVNGIYFPFSAIISTGQISLKSNISSIDVNVKASLKEFE